MNGDLKRIILAVVELLSALVAYFEAHHS